MSCDFNIHFFALYKKKMRLIMEFRLIFLYPRLNLGIDYNYDKKNTLSLYLVIPYLASLAACMIN